MVSPEIDLLLMVLLGVLLGIVLTVFCVKYKKRRTEAVVDLPDPEITDVQCLSATHIRIIGTINPAPPGATLIAFHVATHDDHTHAVGASPDPGAIVYPPTLSGTAFQIDHPHPTSGLTGPPDLAQVWAEYKVYTKDGMSFNCPYGGSGNMFRAARPLGVAGAEQLDAVPRAYRVSPSSPADATGGGPSDLTRALAAALDAVLPYVPEASTPAEPCWGIRGGSGAVREVTLGLLYRAGGFGAVLSALCVVGGREVRLTWVTSDWRFAAPNRLAPESDEPGVPPIVVRPA